MTNKQKYLIIGCIVILVVLVCGLIWFFFGRNSAPTLTSIKVQSGDITEKIIDSFVNGCVPIYWGADNILEYVPKECFIDRRCFKSTKEVDEFLLTITPKQFSEYQNNIAQFLKSDSAKKFSFDHFVSTIVAEITRDIGIEVA